MKSLHFFENVRVILIIEACLVTLRFFKLVYVNKFNLENCTNVKLNLNSFSLLRLIISEKSKYVVKKHWL
jgi:hypothetical protein